MWKNSANSASVVGGKAWNGLSLQKSLTLSLSHFSTSDALYNLQTNFSRFSIVLLDRAPMPRSFRNRIEYLCVIEKFARLISC